MAGLKAEQGEYPILQTKSLPLIICAFFFGIGQDWQRGKAAHAVKGWTQRRENAQKLLQGERLCGALLDRY